MKKIILLLSLVCSQFAMASVTVESVSQYSFIDTGGSKIAQGGAEVDVTIFSFSFVSCATMPKDAFSIEIAESPLGLSSDVQKTVSISLSGPVRDCFGPTYLRMYSIETTEIEVGERYILLNPSVMAITPFVAQ